MTDRRIGILGGTFDPIHCGHIDIARAAEEALGLTRLLLITSHVPPHRAQPVASSHHRFAMVALAVANRPRWRASDIELQSPPPSYTSDTLRHFHREGYAPGELFFVIGADAFAEIETWREYPDILSFARFAVVSRPGMPVAELPRRLPSLADRMMPAQRDGATGSSAAHTWIFLIDAQTADVSSTAIRRRLRDGEPIAGMVPPAVQQHIEQHGLYSSTPLERHAGDALHSPAAGRLHGED
jgi:nicotinate-nucleotide adenylyltransferase